MHKEYLMGNEAIGLAAIASGVNVVAGYPGTPSTEVLEACAKHKNDRMYVEWSVNEKAAMEVGAGASYCGARTLVTMKQVGLNVASDPLMSLEYIGVNGGMVILVADDPGPISSQTEQDTRTFSEFSKLPCFDPSTVQEAYNMVEEAFLLSEKYNTPVFLRPTTRVCHAYSSLWVKDESEYTVHSAEGFTRDTSRFVIFPKLSFQNHRKIEERNMLLSSVLSEYKGNLISGDTSSKKAVVSQGISYTYIEECKYGKMLKTMKISTPHPFPEEKAKELLKGSEEVLVIEESDPYIERHLSAVAGKYNIPVKIYGKLTGHVALSGENTIDTVNGYLASFLGIHEEGTKEYKDCPPLPIRPPVLCPGCPHRASFYAVKKAMAGKKAVFCGDIGCYTLGNAMPLDMVDTCLCMGAGVNIAQSIERLTPDTSCFAFVGDSTFFASAITGVINAVYNKANMTLVVLDNSTTAMTGHQPHPGTGKTVMGEITQKISIENVLHGIGLSFVKTVNPLDFREAVSLVKEADSEKGVKAVIFKSPCVAVVKPNNPMHIDEEKCIACKKCIKELGCPAISIQDSTVKIDSSVCTGCTLCSQICPVNAITGGNENG